MANKLKSHIIQKTKLAVKSVNYKLISQIMLNNPKQKRNPPTYMAMSPMTIVFLCSSINLYFPSGVSFIFKHCKIIHCPLNTKNEKFAMSSWEKIISWGRYSTIRDRRQHSVIWKKRFYFHSSNWISRCVIDMKKKLHRKIFG